MKNTNGKQIMSCQFCHKLFAAKRSDAKFCSASCRGKHHQAVMNGNGKTWHSVAEPAKAMAMQVRSISLASYESLEIVLRQYGARAVEYAILAAYTAASACLAIQEGSKDDVYR